MHLFIYLFAVSAFTNILFAILIYNDEHVVAVRVCVCARESALPSVALVLIRFLVLSDLCSVSWMAFWVLNSTP